MHNILLIEDDREIQENNKDLLESSGSYAVRTAMNLAEAREQISKETPDIIVLDIMLPDGSGLDFIKEINDIPVLCLSALGETNDIVKGLKAGGDDYLAKPYDDNVLLARIESLLRRTESHVPKTLTKGHLSLDIIARRAYIDNNDLLLTHKEFACLLMLAQNEGHIISAPVIYEQIWKQKLEDDKNTLKTTISTLRKKIEPSGYAITVSREQGYTFVINAENKPRK
jgi:DNA-binding response OmpR family regulator